LPRWEFKLKEIGVTAQLARDYFIPEFTSQSGGGQALAFPVARCQTRSQFHVDIKLGSVESRQASPGPHTNP